MKSYKQIQGEYMAKTGIYPSDLVLAKALKLSRQRVWQGIKKSATIRERIAKFYGLSSQDIDWTIDSRKV